jgi:hypothetical protein
MEDHIDTVELFPILNMKLIDLLNSLTEDEFHRSTQFPSWKVKDICAHLLDTSIRRLSGERDRYKSLENPKIESYDDLVKHVTYLADRWALAFTGVSPKILIDLIDKYQTELYKYLKSLKPYEKSFFPVNWAGEEESLNWFDIAREYAERWHHQMQIREALGKEPIYQDELYYPVLDTFMRALPYHYRNWKMEQGYSLCVGINGKSQWKWYLEWNKGIELKKELKKEPNTTIMIDQDKAWKILTRWDNRSIYTVKVNGNKELGEHILDMNCLLISS